MSNLLLVDYQPRNRCRREILAGILRAGDMTVETPDNMTLVSEQYTLALVHISDIHAPDSPGGYEQEAGSHKTPVIWYSGAAQVEEGVLQIARGNEYSTDKWQRAIKVLQGNNGKKAFFDVMKWCPIKDLVAIVAPICLLGKKSDSSLLAQFVFNELDTKKEILLRELKYLGKEDTYGLICTHLSTLASSSKDEKAPGAHDELNMILMDLSRGYL